MSISTITSVALRGNDFHVELNERVTAADKYSSASIDVRNRDGTLVVGFSFGTLEDLAAFIQALKQIHNQVTHDEASQSVEADLTLRA